MSINLLPPQVKREKKLRSAFKEVYFGLAAIFILLVVLVAAFYAYDLIVRQESRSFENKVSDLNSKMPQYKETESKITEINAKLSKIDTIAAERILWSDILDKISGATPKNTQIKSLSLNGDNKTIQLTGTALSRKEVALMKEKLESMEDFKNVTFSSSSYNPATNDYGFSLLFELNK